MPVYKLQYFDVRGVAETIRFMFAVAKVDYEDARFPLTFGIPGDFSTMQRPEFDAAKAGGELNASAGKVPYLQVDGGVKFGQSKTIERYLAQELGLAGASNIEFAQIDAIAEQVRDIKDTYNKAKADADKDAAVAKFFAETLPAEMKKVEGMVPGEAAPFLFGSKISYADIALLQFVGLSAEGFFDNAAAAQASYQDCPKIKSAMTAAAANAEVQAWIAKRPKTMM